MIKITFTSLEITPVLSSQRRFPSWPPRVPHPPPAGCPLYPPHFFGDEQNSCQCLLIGLMHWLSQQPSPPHWLLSQYLPLICSRLTNLQQQPPLSPTSGTSGFQVNLPKAENRRCCYFGLSPGQWGHSLGPVGSSGEPKPWWDPGQGGEHTGVKF